MLLDDPTKSSRPLACLAGHLEFSGGVEQSVLRQAEPRSLGN